MIEQNISSLSCGKDSVAMHLLAIERETENLEPVFADTGNESSVLYEYKDYLNNWLVKKGHKPIRTIRADFTKDMERKRKYIEDKWPAKGVSDDQIKSALAIMQPTGNPFLDLCIMKGRFPSTMVAFCSEELKRNPMIEQVQMPLLKAGYDVVSWQGVRADESPKRALLPERDLKIIFDGAEMWNYRPILKWTAEDCFAMHKKHGIEPNPLYKQGMKRVGCMPCINAGKDELLEISKRFPQEIQRIAEWELIVRQASKRDAATFFAATDLGEKDPAKAYEKGNIMQFVKWAQTGKGGKTLDMFRMQNDGPLCTSIYGLCE